jgi:hypothetical protein
VGPAAPSPLPCAGCAARKPGEPAPGGQASELWRCQDGTFNNLVNDAAASMQPVEPAQSARAHGGDLRLFQCAAVAQHLVQARAAQLEEQPGAT